MIGNQLHYRTPGTAPGAFEAFGCALAFTVEIVIDQYGDPLHVRQHRHGSELAARNQRPGRDQRSAAIRQSGASAQNGFQSFSDCELTVRWPQLDSSHVAQSHTVELDDAAVVASKPDALDADRRIVDGITHQREQAWMPLRTEDAIGVEAEAVGDVRRQTAEIEATGLTQIALGDGARDRHRLLPMRESVFD